MRIDVVTIFPDYLAPLELSLIGRARREGLLDIRVTDLRDFTHDRHRTVDDTPYGGGAGMVMSPQPWGEALDELLGPTETTPTETTPVEQRPVLVVPGPAGQPFTQAVAAELAAYPWLVFACGRYEGIDERVREHARDRLGGQRVREISLGDYVLNGGEVAALAMIEALARLLPGVIGNADSLIEESHAGGLLEYPVYTKPANWRGHEVPAVLLSGDHARIAAWRSEVSAARTAERRPDLLAPEAARTDAGDFPLALALPADAGELWTLTLACGAAGERAPALADVQAALSPASPRRVWTARDPGSRRLVGSVCATAVGDAWQVDPALVAPDLRGRGLGRALLAHAVAHAQPGLARVRIALLAPSGRTLRAYRKAGFRPVDGGTDFGSGSAIVALERSLPGDRSR